MNLLEEKERLVSFIKVGIIVMTSIAVFALGINYMPNSVSVATNNNKKMPIYSVDTEKKEIALSFNMVSGEEATEEILECLKKYQIKATFFTTGKWVEKYPEQIKAIVAAGHDLGNHSSSYQDMTTLTRQECLVEIQDLHNQVKELTGYSMNLFRVPYGEYNNTVIGASEELGYDCIQWNINSMDWKDYEASRILNKVVNNKKLEGGSILLLHNTGKYTVEALPSIIEGLQTKGYTIVAVSELIYEGNYRVDSNGRQHEK